jgi:glyoxylase-like metal-dependent hydrolase (beta-lactamase superfamily II)
MLIRWLYVLGLGVAPCCLAATSIAPGVHLIRGITAAGAQPDGNSIILEAPQGLIVFDTGRHVAHTQQIVEFAGAAGKPVAAIINSHWHLDHIGGNAVLRATYPAAHIYASSALASALGGFLASYRKQLEQAIVASDKDPAAQSSMRAEIALIDAGPKLAPTDVIDATGRRVIAGRELDVHLEHAAVTAGDVWVLDRETGVLMAGDLVTLPAPFLDTACPKRWRATLARLVRTKFKLLIPGHGAPMEGREVETYRRAFDGLLACAASDRTKAACVDGWLRDADTLIPEGDRAYARALIDYYMDQVLRGHAETLAKLCAS